jgi:hypothetical protein
MTLPSYFLADLPPEARLDATMIREACDTLKRNREQYLLPRSLPSVIRTISRLSEEWLVPDNPFRRLALEQGPAHTGFSRQTLEAGLNDFFRQITAPSLQSLVEQDLGHLQRLETLAATDAEQRQDRAAHARGPQLLVHVSGGLLPNPTLTSMILGLLTRSAQFVKCASGTSFLPRLFAHSLHEAEPKLAACLEVAEWRGGSESLEAVLFAEADCITATGRDETLAALRQRVPVTKRFVAYGHRVSFGYVTQEALSGFSPQKVIANAARDVAAWDQLGCLSPHVIYVETGGKVTPEQFAEQLAEQLATLEASHPRRRLSEEEAAAIATRRSFYEVRAANSRDTRLWASPGSTAWTVVFEEDPRFQLSCLNRFIYVKHVASLRQALEAADAVYGKVSTVGLAAPESRALTLAHELARWGVARVCPLGRMQQPPFAWRHDGRPALGDLVTWTDWEL